VTGGEGEVNHVCTQSKIKCCEKGGKDKEIYSINMGSKDRDR
jgi:hypothetical protein